MTSTILSRFLPVGAAGNPSIYETIEQYERALNPPDHESQNVNAFDDDNLDERFHDQDLDRILADATTSDATSQSSAYPQSNLGSSAHHRLPPKLSSSDRPRWPQDLGLSPIRQDDEDSVPESLLLEHNNDTQALLPQEPRPARETWHELPTPVPGPSKGKNIQRRWDQAQPFQTANRAHPTAVPPRSSPTSVFVDAAETAMWRWTNEQNLDRFFREVYDYYLGKGVWSIMLSKVIGLLTLLFVVGFSTFLTSCIDYSSIPTSKTMSQVLIPQCTLKMSAFSSFLIWLFSLTWIMRLVYGLLDIRRLWQLHDFYLHLLGVPDHEMQTITWQEIVSRLMNLREVNPTTALNVSPESRKFMGMNSKQRMDAHDIANRIMRQENYFIALFNKEVLDLTLPLPFLRSRQLFSKTLEMNIQFCINCFVFNKQGQLNQLFLKDTHRRELIDTLRARFFWAGVFNVILAPFIVTYTLILFFLSYFSEYHKNPAQLSSRAYTPLAEWRFSEFNELPHLLSRRLNMSIPFASRYLDQFPKDKTVQLARFVAFIAGALAAVLALASLLDPDLFLGFEITHERTVLFYLGVLTTIWAVARAIVPDEHHVFDPEFAIQNVIDYTHYAPTAWHGRLHSDEVRRDFSALYRPKILIFLEEIASMLFTPLVLWFTLPSCSERVVDFFREFTVHVDGLGYLCSFALFDFNKGGDDGVAGERRSVSATHLRHEYYASRDGKMLSSYFSFIDNYARDPRQATVREALPHTTALTHVPPPDFPGLVARPQSSTTVSDGTRMRSSGLRNIVGKASGIGVTGGDGIQSPAPSLLLDPRHQPSAAVLHEAANRRLRMRRARPSRFAEHLTEDEEGEGRSQVDRDISSSAIITEEGGRLGESRIGVAASAGAEHEPDAEVQDIVGPGGGAGVLGLLSQFRAQAEAGPGLV